MGKRRWGQEKTKKMIILDFYLFFSKFSFLNIYWKNSAHSLFGAWSFLLVHICFTPYDEPNDFVNWFFKISDHGTWSIWCHVGIHVDFTTFVLHSHAPLGPSSVVWSELGPAPPFPPMSKNIEALFELILRISLMIVLFLLVPKKKGVMENVRMITTSYDFALQKDWWVFSNLLLYSPMDLYVTVHSNFYQNKNKNLYVIFFLFILYV